DSERQKVEVCYSQRALEILHRSCDKRFVWLCDEEATMAGRVKLNFGILAALGRIEDEEELRAMALQICELKPKTREAIVMIRRFRNGSSPPSVWQVTEELCRVLDGYNLRHPAVTKEQI